VGGMGGMGGMGPMGPMGGMGGMPGMRRPKQRQRATTGSAEDRADRLAPGTRVKLHSLSVGELNGQSGSVLGYDSAKERYEVKLAASGEVKSFSVDNVCVMAQCTVMNVESKPQLNGQRGVVSAFDAEKESYTVQVGAGSEVQHLLLKAGKVRLADGTSVRLCGLSDGSLNGRWGRVTNWDQDKERYTVQLLGKAVSLRPVNVVCAGSK